MSTRNLLGGKVRPAETSADTQRTTWGHIPEDDNLQALEMSDFAEMLIYKFVNALAAQIVTRN
jgi:hypothetical protein